MNELIKHIEHLLLKHDCVVLPHFGGFVTQTLPARWVEDENLFLPPVRTVRFNPDLQADDGLLTRSMMHVHRCSELRAARMVTDMVNRLTQTLLENGSCDCGSIGVFTQDEEGNISFSPCQAGTVCPSYYGLDACRFPLLEQLPTLQPEKETPAPTVPFISQDEKHIIIRLNRKAVNVCTTVAAAVMLFFMLATTAHNTDVVPASSDAQSASLYIPGKFTPPVLEVVPETVQTVVDTLAVEQVTEVVEAPVQAEVVEEVEATPEASGYCVVLASAIPMKNATAYAADLTERGMQNVRVHKSGSMTRVIMDGFSTEAEAYTAASRLHRQGEEFASAWVLKL